MTNNFQNTFIVNNKKVEFNLQKYLKDSLNITRDLMPQIDYDEFFKNYDLFDKYIRIMKLKVPANLLKPIQNEINLEKVVNKLVKAKEEEEKNQNTERFFTNDKVPFFITSNDFHIIDGHHSHVQILMDEPTKLVDLYMFDLNATELYNFFTNLKSFLREYKDITDTTIIESIEDYISFGIEYILECNENAGSGDMGGYGIQGPEAITGMGTVNFGKPSTASSNGEKGSGDIMSPNGTWYQSRPLLKRQEKNENTARFFTEEELKNIAQKYYEEHGVTALEAARKERQSLNESENEIEIDESEEEFQNLTEKFKSEQDVVKYYDNRINELPDKNKPQKGGTYGNNTRRGRYNKDNSKEYKDLVKRKDKAIDKFRKERLEKSRNKSVDESKPFELLEFEERNQLLFNSISLVNKSLDMFLNSNDSAKRSALEVFVNNLESQYSLCQQFIMNEMVNEDKPVEEKNKILSNHFPKDLSDEIKGQLKVCMNKVVLKKYMEVPDEFSCETMEGIVQGKAGDILMVGVDGEIYPVDKSVFEQTYQRV